MLRTHLVKKDQRALLFHRGDFTDILEPGKHVYFDPLKRYSVEHFELDSPLFSHRLADYLVKAKPGLVDHHFTVVEIQPHEIGLRYENGVLKEVLPASTRRLYWKGFVEVRVDRIDLRTQTRIEDTLVSQLMEVGPNGFRAKVTNAHEVFVLPVPQYHLALLFANGTLSETLTPGIHAFWRGGRDLRVEMVDMRLQALEVSGQEILTRDKVSLRINLTAGYRMTDLLEAYAKLANPQEHLYRELQFGLRAAVGTRTLDELLENKHLLDDIVMAHVRKTVSGMGMEVISVGIKDIILPGEMKALLAKVVEAEKAAQANVIGRREETAATRSLLNTAKVMEDNPVALRLKELETLERITGKIDKISVFGGLDGVLQELVKIKP